MASSRAAAEMASVMPHTRVISIVCDPTRRVWSDLNQWHLKIERDVRTRANRYTEYHGCPLMRRRFTGQVLRQLTRLNATGLRLDELCPMRSGGSFADCNICAYLRGSYFAGKGIFHFERA